MERVLTQDYSMIPSLTLLPVKYEYGGSPCGRIIPHVQPGVKKEAPELDAFELESLELDPIYTSVLCPDLLPHKPNIRQCKTYRRQRHHTHQMGPDEKQALPKGQISRNGA